MLELADARPPFSMDGLGLAVIAMAAPGPGHEG